MRALFAFQSPHKITRIYNKKTVHISSVPCNVALNKKGKI